MAKELFNSDFYTLPEQVQINKEDIKTNTTDIAKLKDDIGKIKPDAWEERKFALNVGEEGNADFTTYNPITDTNAPVNIQKSFTDKDTYSTTEPVNSYSFFTSGSLNDVSMSIYAICTDPSNTLLDLLALDEQKESGVSIVLVSSKNEIDEDEAQSSLLYINCTNLTANNITSKSLSIKDSDANVKEINKITDNDDDSLNSLLTAFAINEYYLKKTDASNTYLTKTDASNTYLSKTDASNTYVTKQDYYERYDTGDISLTQAGYNKINSMAENIGTTITLTATSDFTENTQVSNTCELILSVNYNANPIYRNIHLMPNQTIDDYTAYQDATEENWYTGHAILVLSSQDYGYFAITYQNGTHSQLILTLIAHY